MGLLVVDTNCIIQSLPKRSQYHELWQSFFDGRNSLCVSNEILEEYEEILEEKTSHELASNVIKAIINNPYTYFVTPHFRFDLINADPDDNKFVDCAVASNAKFLVTQDKHFDVLKHVEFPCIEIITLTEMMNILRNT